ncbi:MAG: hypothetical protein HY077_10480 [Elusimicrobia bacterium]|nr:hypothetical protein [Elusimicrobiota bacterium]
MADACGKCNKLMALIPKWFRCTKCESWFCPSCMDRFCLFCKAPVVPVAKT